MLCSGGFYLLNKIHINPPMWVLFHLCFRLWLGTYIPAWMSSTCCRIPHSIMMFWWQYITITTQNSSPVWVTVWPWQVGPQIHSIKKNLSKQVYLINPLYFRHSVVFISSVFFCCTNERKLLFCSLLNQKNVKQCVFD